MAKSLPALKRVSALEETMALHLRGANIKFQREYAFAAHYVGRSKGIKARLNALNLKNWRFDFAIPDKMLAIEVEGGIWSNGRHTTGAGFQADCEKYNSALLLGWRVLRFTDKHIKSGQALQIIERFIEKNKAA